MIDLTPPLIDLTPPWISLTPLWIALSTHQIALTTSLIDLTLPRIALTLAQEGLYVSNAAAVSAAVVKNLTPLFNPYLLAPTIPFLDSHIERILYWIALTILL